MASPATTVVFPTHRDLYYGGRWHAGKSGRLLDVANPATGAALGKVVDADANDVDSAVTAARAAFPAWRDAPAQDRARAVRKAAAILRALEMPDDEQAARIRRMRTTVKDHNVFRWAANLLSDLTDIRIELPERQENVLVAGEVAAGDEQEEVRP